MSRLSSLPADQRAVLQLLLQKDRSYEEIAQLLRANTASIRLRAADAVALVAPDASALPDAQRHEITDYLLGEQTATVRATTRSMLAGDRVAAQWAREAIEALRPLAGDRLPDVPEHEGAPGSTPVALPSPPKRPEAPTDTKGASSKSEAEDGQDPAGVDDAEPQRSPRPDRSTSTSTFDEIVPPAPAASDGPRNRPTIKIGDAARSSDVEPVGRAASAQARLDATAAAARGTGSGLRSRLGWPIAAALIAAVIAGSVLGIFRLIGAGGDDPQTASTPVDPAPSTSVTTTTPDAAPATPEPRLPLNGEIVMRPLGGRTGPKATVTLITQAGKQSVALTGQGLSPTTSKSFYGLWFANARSDATFLGFAPRVTGSGKLRLFDALPDTADPTQFTRIWLTREVVPASQTSPPPVPGKVVLAGDAKP